jgi:hypothetical protein
MHKKIESSNLLRNECLSLCSYLIDQIPPDYLIDKYIDAHERSNLYNLNKSSRFDNILLKLARKHPILLKLTDVYTSIFRRSSIFRKKIILILALLESDGPSHCHVDPIREYHKGKFLIKLAYKLQYFIISLIFSAIVFWPLRIVFLLKEKPND